MREVSRVPGDASAPDPDEAPTPRIVSVRRPTPVTISLRETEGAAAGRVMSLDVCVEARPIVQLAVTAEKAAALVGLLQGPAWLLIVAVDVSGGVVGRLWALLPAARSAPLELRDEDLVYSVPLAELRLAETERGHPGDLLAEARGVLGVVAPGDPPPQ